MKPFDVDTITKYTCDTIKGMKDVYLVWFVGAMHVNKLLKKPLICFYFFLWILISWLVKIYMDQLVGAWGAHS